MTDRDTNRGAIWKNERKDSPNHPDFRGSLNVNGQEFWVSAWKRDPNGNPKAPALKFSIQPKDSPQHSQAAQSSYGGKGSGAAPASQKEDFDDEIPF